MADDERFRNAGRYAATQGFAGGFPNFHQAGAGSAIVHGTLLLSPALAEWRDIPRDDLAIYDAGVLNMEDVPAVVRSVNRWAYANGFVGGLPTFEQADYGQGVVLGALLMGPGSAEWRDVPREVLGVGGLDDVGRLMRRVNDYSDKEGFAAGFPTFEEADYGAGVVAGVLLFHGTAVTWRDVYAEVLSLQGRYTFDAGFTDVERLTVMERWALAYERLLACGAVRVDDIEKIVVAFRKAINHTLNAAVGANASAPIGGSTININRTNFFGLVARERAQTLLHEMTHLAGFDHPDRRDCPPNTAPNCDTPGDNGLYFGTVPLQAELCIAGVQSDVACVPSAQGQTCEQPPSPRIVSIDYNPPGSDVDRERVRILHSGGAPTQMKGWTLSDTVGHTYDFPVFTLSPDQSVEVWTGKGTDTPSALFWGRRQAVWTNKGDTATLTDSSGTIRQTYTYA